MNQANHQYKEEGNPYSHSLKQSMQKLNKQSLISQKERSGLSQTFRQQSKSMEASMVLCEKAMTKLANDYVEQFSLFSTSSSPIEAIEALNKSEEIWQEHAEVIKRLNPGGKEHEFLNRMREHTLKALENKILDTSQPKKRELITEYSALHLAALGIIDKILGELGYPKSCPTRQRLTKIAHTFVTIQNPMKG